MTEMRGAGLRIVERGFAQRRRRAGWCRRSPNIGHADVVQLVTHVDPDSRRALFRASDVVLANSAHEPFGLVGLEAMAVGGIACTGCSGEDYAMPGRNALVLQTGTPGEFIGLYRQLRGPAIRGGAAPSRPRDRPPLRLARGAPHQPRAAPRTTARLTASRAIEKSPCRGAGARARLRASCLTRSHPKSRA